MEQKNYPNADGGSNVRDESSSESDSDPDDIFDHAYETGVEEYAKRFRHGNKWTHNPHDMKRIWGLIKDVDHYNNIFIRGLKPDGTRSTRRKNSYDPKSPRRILGEASLNIRAFCTECFDGGYPYSHPFMNLQQILQVNFDLLELQHRGTDNMKMLMTWSEIRASGIGAILTKLNQISDDLLHQEITPSMSPELAKVIREIDHPSADHTQQCIKSTCKILTLLASQNADGQVEDVGLPYTGDEDDNEDSNESSSGDGEPYD